MGKSANLLTVKEMLREIVSLANGWGELSEKEKIEVAEIMIPLDILTSEGQFLHKKIDGAYVFYSNESFSNDYESLIEGMTYRLKKGQNAQVPDFEGYFGLSISTLSGEKRVLIVYDKNIYLFEIDKSKNWKQIYRELRYKNQKK